MDLLLMEYLNGGCFCTLERHHCIKFYPPSNHPLEHITMTTMKQHSFVSGFGPFCGVMVSVLASTVVDRARIDYGRSCSH